MIPQISVSVKAVVRRRGDVLLLSYSGSRFHYNLPGGKARKEESLTDAVERKVFDETGLTVTCGPLLFVVEYVPGRWNNEFGDIQKVQFQFATKTDDTTAEPRFSEPRDPRQIGFEWMPIEQLGQVNLLPRIGSRLAAALTGQPGPAFIDRW